MLIKKIQRGLKFKNHQFMKVSVYRKAHFNAAHRLYVKDWSDDKNRRVFGVCSNPNFHGHNYELEVRLTGETDPITGMLINLKELKHLIKVHIEDHFDHKNLNLDVAEFAELIPTSENICYVIYKILRAVISQKYALHIRLYETPRNFVEYPAAISDY